MNRKKTPYLLIAPYMLVYFAFSMFPIIFSFIISFTNWNGAFTPEFCGLDNYIRIFTKDILFLKSLKNTVILLFMIMPFQLGIGLLMACLLKDFFRRARRGFQLINFLPYPTTSVAVGIIFQLLFATKSGFVNEMLRLIGIDGPYWLGVPWLSRVVVAIMEIWKQYGYMMIMFLSGLSTIPEELYEAARIDGAKWYQSFLRITIPMLRPIFAFCVTTSMIASFNLFDSPQLLFQGLAQPLGGPDRSVLTVVMRFYEASFQVFEFGFGSAIAYCLFVIISILSFVMVRALNGKEA